RIVLTGDLEHQTVFEAVNAGHVYSFLNKPCTPEVLLRTVDSTVKHYALAMSERELLEKTLSGSVQVLIDVLAMVDANAFGRGQALKEQVQALLPLLNQAPSWECEMASSLATIGTVTIPPSVLHRWRVHGEMGAEEHEMLRQVPLAGNRLIAKIPRLEEVARIILYQSKHFDGSGFPEDALAGAAIPLGARLLKVLSDLMDFEDGGMPREEVLPIMERRSGLYDPTVLQAVSKLPSNSRNLKTDAEGGSHSIKFRDLRPGHVLIANITTPDGVVVVAGGQKISPTML
ncbi:MAG: hypothetical protein NTW03_07545, partial [Verrucomicrobia bacterium]|nr:hypothetical protein [Verrucomicrobiota bacterium]